LTGVTAYLLPVVIFVAALFKAFNQGNQRLDDKIKLVSSALLILSAFVHILSVRQPQINLTIGGEYLFFPALANYFRVSGRYRMSGGFIGGLAGMLIWCAKNKRPALQWMDAMGTAIPLGYTFGRLGNFFNAELYGRITTVPWGMIFPDAPKFSLSIGWVRKIAEEAGLRIAADATLVNLPRHPSQLYEAFFEGIVLFALLWFLRKKKPFHGFLTAVYTGGYGIVRFIIEYFREPDADIGYRISVQADAPIYFNQSLLNLSTGQIFCLAMILSSCILLAVLAILNRKRRPSS